ncbi:hypothetical protein GJ496_001690 [Pomphorhynchus laevis]|nr:hypothetical protein GJ496_005024 [Pomphorhynchus laevis]KAI0981324.1 hypothetical protein GJ496_001690 [Pomphorhynchus laevis]
MSAQRLSKRVEAAQVKVKDLKNQLSIVENQIYALEGSYLQNTADFGNVVSGWKSFIRNVNEANCPSTQPINDCDRIFSMSSTTSPLYSKGKEPNNS